MKLKVIKQDWWKSSADDKKITKWVDKAKYFQKSWLGKMIFARKIQFQNQQRWKRCLINIWCEFDVNWWTWVKNDNGAPKSGETIEISLNENITNCRF